MKNKLKFFGIAVLIATIGFSMAGCGDGANGDDLVTVNRAALSAAIVAAEARLYVGNTAVSANGADVLVGSYWVTAEARNALLYVLADAQTVHADPSATQAEVNDAASTLAEAYYVFYNAREQGTLPLTCQGCYGGCAECDPNYGNGAKCGEPDCDGECDPVIVEGALGPTLNLTGQVYIADEWTYYGIPIWATLTPFPASETRTVTAIGETGTITNGQLIFSMGSPDNSFLEDIANLSYDWFGPATISNYNARSTLLNLSWGYPWGLSTEFDEFVAKGYFSQDDPWMDELIFYMYVSQDVDLDFSYGGYYGNFILSLSQGWNVFHLYMSYEAGGILSGISPPAHLRWLLDNWDGSGYRSLFETIGHSGQARSGAFGASLFRTRR